MEADMNRAVFTGSTGAVNIGAYGARPSGLAASMSKRLLRTKAGVAVIAASRLRTPGRTVA
jgi:hypothetical protein